MALNNDTPIPGLVQGPVREHFADESSSASEHEVEQVLEGESDPSCAPTCSFSTRESPHALCSSSESDCDSELSHSSGPIPTILADEDEEDEQQPRGAATAIVGTKNEILDPVVVLPDLVEVDPSEPIELIGQVQSIIDSIVIIRGLGSQTQSAAVERVLDADSLLVFEDRKVLGNVSHHIFEVF
jgi:H/ACA ribonucleoprotein complex non-core subunit NAF1